MLYSFTPTAGRKANVRYLLPTSSTDSRVNDRNSTLQTMPMADGDYDSSGTAPMPMKSGAFTVTFDLYPAWYKLAPNGWDYYNGSNSDMVARENALLDFIVSVVEGGEGTLVDEYSARGNIGIRDPVTGAAISNYACQAKVGGGTTITRIQGRATIEVPWVVQSAYWTASTGQLVAIF